MIRKTSAIDPEAEELTPEGEKAFLEGLASVYEDASQHRPGDMVRRSFDNLPGTGSGEKDTTQSDAVWDSSEVFKDVVKNIPWYAYPAFLVAKILLCKVALLIFLQAEF